MNNHLDLRVTKKLEQQAAVDSFCKGIYRDSLTMQADLDETQLRPVGVLPEKLSVKGE